ncbi:Lcl C-terminal domain-containing protein [Campylobacter rectus]|uniref:Lcl C-terminal domain-containing protein n=1 Tax=Campylobacter rectus TaxID=203 RepID=UPI000F5F6D31|nr:DUF1566 domain-containing protein [Campylobacter rectus]RRD52553.1 DUF1566 domain-containing protein [Campylobacter rectus]
MKKILAFIALFAIFAVGATADQMGEVEAEEFYKSEFKKAGLPPALKGEAYKRVFNEYMDEDPDGLLRNGKHKELAKFRTKYCYRGFYEACQKLGEQYMLGLGVETDFKRSVLLMNYSLINSEYKYLKIRSKKMLDLLKSISEEKVSADKRTKAIIHAFAEATMQCYQEKTKERNCLFSLILSEAIPTSLIDNEIPTLNGQKALDIKLAVVEMMKEDIGKHKSSSQFVPMIIYYNEMLSYASNSRTQTPNLTQSETAPLSYKVTYRDDSERTVVDTTYRLMWQDDDKIFEGTWDEAKHYCENLNFAWYDDWSLPTRSELLSIIDDSKDHPAINGTFKNVKQDRYWSSMKSADSSPNAWVVNFKFGYEGWSSASGKSFVRCVRRY